MAEEVILRPMTAADKPACARMMAALNIHENAFVGDRLTDIPSAEAHVDFLESAAGKDGGFILVAEHDGAILGFLVGFVEMEDGSYVVPGRVRYGFISDLYVEEAARGLGLAPALLREAEKRYRALGLAEMRVSALVGNNVALRVYDRFGFHEKEIVLAKQL